MICDINHRVTSEQQIALVNRRKALIREIADLRAHRDEVALGTQSATLSTGDGSNSYTNFSPEKIQSVIETKVAELRSVTRQLAGGAAGGIRHVVTVRC